MLVKGGKIREILKGSKRRKMVVFRKVFVKREKEEIEERMKKRMVEKIEEEEERMKKRTNKEIDEMIKNKFPSWMPDDFFVKRRQILKDRKGREIAYKYALNQRQSLEEDHRNMGKMLYGPYKKNYKLLQYDIALKKNRWNFDRVGDYDVKSDEEELKINERGEKLDIEKKDIEKMSEMVKKEDVSQSEQDVKKMLKNLWTILVGIESQKTVLMEKKKRDALDKQIVDRIWHVFEFIKYKYMYIEDNEKKFDEETYQKHFESIYKIIKKDNDPVDLFFRVYNGQQEELYNEIFGKKIDLLFWYKEEKNAYIDTLDAYKEEYTKYVYDFYRMTEMSQKELMKKKEGYFYLFYVLEEIFEYRATLTLGVKVIRHLMRMEQEFKADTTDVLVKKVEDHAKIAVLHDEYNFDIMADKIDGAFMNMINEIYNCFEQDDTFKKENELIWEFIKKYKESIVDVGDYFIDKYTEGLSKHEIGDKKRRMEKIIQLYEDCTREKKGIKEKRSKNMFIAYNLLYYLDLFVFKIEGDVKQSKRKKIRNKIFVNKKFTESDEKVKEQKSISEFDIDVSEAKKNQHTKSNTDTKNNANVQLTPEKEIIVDNGSSVYEEQKKIKAKDMFWKETNDDLESKLKNFAVLEKAKKWDWMFSLLQALVRMEGVEHLESDKPYIQSLLDSIKDVKEKMESDTLKNINPRKFIELVFSFSGMFTDGVYEKPVKLLKMILYHLKLLDQERFLIKDQVEVETLVLPIKIKTENKGESLKTIINNKITRASDHLIIELKQEGGAFGSIRNILSMRDDDGEAIKIDEDTYVLKSVVMRDEPGVHSFTYSYIINKKGEKEWFRFDDQDVSINNSPASSLIQDIENEFYMIHLLFYEKKGQFSLSNKKKEQHVKEETLTIDTPSLMGGKKDTKEQKKEDDPLNQQIKGMIEHYEKKDDQKETSIPSQDDPQFKTMDDLFSTKLDQEDEED